jgi:uncharacterized membrane protein
MPSNDHHSKKHDRNEPNPAALSFAGGFAGTVTGLKRGGVPGAVLGGVIGGTVGYLAGASARAGSPARESHETEPISIDTAEADTDEQSDATGRGDDPADHDSQHEDEPADSSSS